MTETPPRLEQEEPPEGGQAPEPMPRWVPVAIGVVLVTLAALAVITGLRYRENTLADLVKPHPPVQRGGAPAPPGEPEPGASLVLSGDGVPAAAPPSGDSARAEITGGRGGVSAIIRMSARRGVNIAAEPGDAAVYVNDVLVGQAKQFDSEDEIYDFAAPGSYTIVVTAPGFRDRRFVVTASDDAPADVAKIRVKLEREQT
jgi:hypothetical protein